MEHTGIDKTYELIGRKYYWPRLFNEVMAYVANCEVCQTQGSGQRDVPLVEIGVPNFPF